MEHATIISENGYALCQRHADIWVAGGWDGLFGDHSDDPMGVGEALFGIRTLVSCADCIDEHRAEWAQLVADIHARRGRDDLTLAGYVAAADLLDVAQGVDDASALLELEARYSAV